jgi:flagellar biosynthetic protein FliS
MYPNQTLRGRFTEDGLTTASGPRIVVMCFDRLDRDLGEALGALNTHDTARSHELLCHAQDIVHELLFMLDLESWEHAATLAAIYRYVMELLTRSNVTKRQAEAIEARRLLAELGDAFRQASVGLATPAEYSEPSTQFSVRA